MRSKFENFDFLRNPQTYFDSFYTSLIPDFVEKFIG